MLKKIVMLSAIFGMALLFCGCSSLQTGSHATFNGQAITPSGESLAHITAEAGGLYFLWIPLFTGSTRPEADSIVFNEDTVNVTALTEMVTRESKRLNATRTTGLVSSHSSTMWPVPIPFLFYWRSATVSGNAVK